MGDVISRSLMPSDYDLARAIGRGDPSGIDLLYARHKTKVYSLCLRMTGNSAEAEDLTQEVFLQLLAKVGSFRGEVSLQLGSIASRSIKSSCISVAGIVVGIGFLKCSMS
jgi:hypothetical protein